MPIYEFTCDGCHHDFELLVRSSSAKTNCPECGSSELRRRFSTFAAHGGGGKSACEQAGCPAADSNGACPAGGCCAME